MKMRKYVISAVLVICMCIGLSACDAKSNPEMGTILVDGNKEIQTPTEKNIPEGDSYIAVPIQIPHERIYNEYIWQNYLFYLADDYGETVVVRIDLDNPEDLIVMPLGYPAMPLDNQDEWRSQHLAVDDNGMIHIFGYTQELVDGYYESADVFWNQVDDGGAIIRTISVNDVFNMSIGLGHFCVDSAGNVYLAAYSFQFYNTHDSWTVLFVLNPDGEVIFETPIPKMIDFFFKDSTDAVNIYYLPDSSTSQINLTTGNLDKGPDISRLPDSYKAIGLGVGTDGALFYANWTGAYDYNSVKDEMTERLKWASAGLFIYGDGNTRRVYPLADGRYLWVVYPHGGGGYPRQTSYRIIRRQTAEDIAAAEALARQWEELKAGGRVGDITIAAVGYIDREIIKLIQEFNSAHPYSRIELKRYGATIGDDHSEGLAQLNLEIITGRGPDMLLLPQDLSYGAYATMGLFHDLYPFLEADVGFDMTDYRENIIRAYEIGGKLYGIPISFGIEMLYARSGELDGLTSWNMNQFVAFADRFPGSSVFQHPTKTEVLDICLRANGGNLVDWASNEISFNRDLVKKILEFAGRFADTDEYFLWPGIIDEYMERISDGDIHLVRGNAAVASRQFYEELFQGPVTPIGYPSESGNGYLIYSNNVVTISSQCKYIDTAWEFISFLLSDEVQSRVNHPVRRQNIERHLKNEREKVGLFRGGTMFSYEERPATEEEIKAFLELLDMVSEIRLFDQQIDNIIKEEAGSYFSGSKPLDSVVDVIANRVGIYVMEIK